jgi:probable HAF family extracellular repeat protein
MSRVILTTMPSMLIACVFGTSAQGAVQYTVTLLNPGGGIGAAPYAINDTGQVAGVMSGDPYRAFLYEKDGPMRDLGSLSATGNSAALAINSHGWIAGYADNAFYARHAVIFSDNGSVQDLGTLGGVNSSAYGINDSGRVVGVAALANGDGHAFMYSQQQGMQDLGTFGGAVSSASAINSAGAVVGLASLRSPSGSGDIGTHAFLYTAVDGMRDLGTLGGQNSVATAINSAGQIAGYSEFSSTPELYHAALWNADGSLTDLASLSPYYSKAFAINDAGQVVGDMKINAIGDRHAFLWNGSAMIDLNDLIDPSSGWTLEVATGINSYGQIVGQGSFPGYRHRGAFLLTPVPDPATLLLLSAGLLGVLSRRRR